MVWILLISTCCNASNRAAHHLDKHAVVAGGVIGFHHFLQAFELFQRRRVVLGTLQYDADKAADVVAQLFWVHIHPRSGDDPGLLHLLHPHMNGAGLTAKFFASSA